MPIVEVKVSVDGVMDRTGAGAAVPVPVSAMDCGEPAALSLTERFAAKVATEVGAKVREIRQLPPAASDAPHVLVCVKLPAPAPVIPMPAIVSGALPLLVSCAVCTALVLPLVAVNVKETGVREAMGAGTAVPVPLSETVCGEPVALSATESVALKLLTDDGVKITEMLQL
jgi:hypothetical protein